MKKRLLSALLTFCMVLTMLPVSALAADPPATDGSTQIEGSYYTYDPQDHEFSPDGDEDPAPDQSQTQDRRYPDDHVRGEDEPVQDIDGAGDRKFPGADSDF